eukprot:TRINITY_DN592_c1_g2_i1.p1 TRINITY_DN592_c1_g2~~TRINITY_DN592_c1_g2_i1.p1  ORF type:complete len:596 (+),score=100.76 TRINITY_DN592_c1_g2_i1:621-2408(+)
MLRISSHIRCKKSLKSRVAIKRCITIPKNQNDINWIELLKTMKKYNQDKEYHKVCKLFQDIRRETGKKPAPFLFAELAQTLLSMKAEDVQPDMDGWNSLVDLVTATQGFKDALEVPEVMESVGVKADINTYNNIMDAMISTESFHYGSRVLFYMKSRDIKPNVETVNPLIEHYSSKNNHTSVRDMLSIMRKHQIIPNERTAMIIRYYYGPQKSKGDKQLDEIMMNFESYCRFVNFTIPHDLPCWSEFIPRNWYAHWPKPTLDEFGNLHVPEEFIKADEIHLPDENNNYPWKEQLGNNPTRSSIAGDFKPKIKTWEELEALIKNSTSDLDFPVHNIDIDAIDAQMEREHKASEIRKAMYLNQEDLMDYLNENYPKEMEKLMEDTQLNSDTSEVDKDINKMGNMFDQENLSNADIEKISEYGGFTAEEKEQFRIFTTEVDKDQLDQIAGNMDSYFSDDTSNKPLELNDENTKETLIEQKRTEEDLKIEEEFNKQFEEILPNVGSEKREFFEEMKQIFKDPSRIKTEATDNERKEAENMWLHGNPDGPLEDKDIYVDFSGIKDDAEKWSREARKDDVDPKEVESKLTENLKGKFRSDL